MSMKPSKFDIFYWWGIFFSSIPLMLIFIVIGVFSSYLHNKTSVDRIVVTEVINIEPEPKIEIIDNTPKVEPKTPATEIVKSTVHHTVQDTVHHTVQDSTKIKVVSDTTKKSNVDLIN